MGLFDWLFKPNVPKMKLNGDIGGLILALSYEKDARVRSSAAFALRTVSSENIEEPLIKALDDQEADVRKWAAYSLGLRGTEKSVQPLLKLLSDPDLGVRFYAASSLGCRGDERALDTLLELYDHDRTEAARSLGEIGSPLAVDKLIKTLYDWNESARRAATNSLAAIKDPRAIEPLIKNMRSGASWALTEIGEPAVEPLISALEFKDFNVRQGAAKTLGRIKDIRAVDPLIKALGDEVRFVRANVAEALGNIGDKRAVKPLINVLKDEYSVRKEAAIALGKIGDTSWTNYFIDELRRSQDLQWEYATILAMMGALEGVDPILDYLYQYSPNSFPQGLTNIFGDYAGLIIESLRKGIEAHEYWDGTLTIEWRYTYNLSRSDWAVMEFCWINNPLTSNLLHKISRKKDRKVVTIEHCYEENNYMVLDFRKQRKWALEELEKRNNPPYDPLVYLKADNWKLESLRDLDVPLKR